MNRAYRKVIVAGNWKMNMKPSDVRPYADRLKAGLPELRGCEIVLCVPAIDIFYCAVQFRKTRVRVGAQNVFPAHSGAYTGEISPDMLADAGCRYVIVGHSERRAMGETDAFVTSKVTAVLEAQLRPILCVGESLEQHRAGETLTVLESQLRPVLEAMTPRSARQLVLAYEPIWAIGTGESATPEQAQQVCAQLRAMVRTRLGAAAARGMSILYGGSMNETNASQLLAQPDIDGGLIGGASLSPERLLSIVEAANALM